MFHIGDEVTIPGYRPLLDIHGVVIGYEKGKIIVQDEKGRVYRIDDNDPEELVHRVQNAE